jgi:hypothetical protein
VASTIADDPVRRNLLITECYHDLSAAFGQALRADNATWCALHPGSTTDGQALLRSALGHYAEARTEPDAHRKAELMLLGNGQIGLHEQRRLQPFIAGSIDVPVDDALQGSLDTLMAPLPGLLRRPLEATLARMAHPLAAAAQTVWQELCTRELMTLTLPDGTLLLGRDIPARPGQPAYPATLTAIDDEDLAAMLRAYGADRPDYVGSAAVDWTVLTERMRYILDLFRARQTDAALLGQPFSAEQRAAMVAGRPVTGPL